MLLSFKNLFLSGFVLCCLFGISIYSCKGISGQNNTGTTTDTILQSDTLVPYDTVKRNQIDLLVDQLNNSLRQSNDNHRFAFPVYSPKDTIEYWIVGGEAVRISFIMHPEDKIIWPSFFITHGKLIQVRSRMASDKPLPRWSRETMIYLEDGKIVHCEERGKTLETGESVGIIRRLELAKSTRSIPEIEKEYKDYWPKVQKAVEEDMNHSVPK
jgi:hypothetical protein